MASHRPELCVPRLSSCKSPVGHRGHSAPTLLLASAYIPEGERPPMMSVSSEKKMFSGLFEIAEFVN